LKGRKQLNALAPKTFFDLPPIAGNALIRFHS
jgi:hypothetical protein